MAQYKKIQLNPLDSDETILHPETEADLVLGLEQYIGTYSIAQVEPDPDKGFNKAYVLQKNGITQAGKINLKDETLVSANVKICTQAGDPILGLIVGDLYAEYVIKYCVYNEPDVVKQKTIYQKLLRPGDYLKTEEDTSDNISKISVDKNTLRDAMMVDEEMWLKSAQSTEAGLVQPCNDTTYDNKEMILTGNNNTWVRGITFEEA